MKKSILFLAALFIVNLASAQSYFGYCMAQSGGHTYVSEVVDLTTLPNENVPKVAPYGKIKLADYYDRVAKQWFAAIMKKNGIDVQQPLISTQLIAGIEGHGNACKTGYEAACMCQNKDAAIKQRDKDVKVDPKTITLK